MAQGRRLRDLVPVVLDGPVPESTGQRLVRGRRGAVCHAQRLDLVEGIAVRVGGQGGRRAGAKLAGALQRERLDVRPARELGLRGEIRWSRLIIAREGSEKELEGRGRGSVVGSKGEDAIGDILPDANAFRLPGSVGNLGQRSLQ